MPQIHQPTNRHPLHQELPTKNSEIWLKSGWGSWSAIFLKLFLLTLPFRVQSLLYKADIFLGEFNVFASFFLNISEVFLLLSLLAYGLERLIFPDRQKDLLSSFSRLELFLSSSLVLLLLWSLAGVFWADDKVLVLLGSLRLMELFGLIFLIISEVLPRETLLKYLFWGALLQVVLGLGQYLKQGSLGLGFLGESQLSVDSLNVAKVDLGGEKILRAYGTFAHANIFAGYLVLAIGLLGQSIRKENFWSRVVMLVILLAGVLLSFSRSAWLAVLAMLVVFVTSQAIRINWKQLLLGGLLLVFVMVLFSLDQVIWARLISFSMQALDERLIFSEIARNMIWQNVWIGVGSGNFILNMTTNFSGVLTPWLYQPVHNFFLMILSEMGGVGFLIWMMVLGSTVKQIGDSMRRILKSERFYWKAYLALFLGLLVLSMLDHYLYTSWVGQVMVFLMIALVWNDYRQRRLELSK